MRQDYVKGGRFACCSTIDPLMDGQAIAEKGVEPTFVSPEAKSDWQWFDPRTTRLATMVPRI
jgi:hypothetical protein